MKDFRHALLWHMAEHQTKIAELASGAGVSSDVIKKLRTRENASTSAETAARIAAYYGKGVSEFIACEPASRMGELSALMDLLSDQERTLLLAQVRGLLAAREHEE